VSIVQFWPVEPSLVPGEGFCEGSRAGWEEKLSIRFGGQGGVTHKDAVLLNGVGHGGDSNDASYDAFNHNFLSLMLAGDGCVRRSLGGAIGFSIRRATVVTSRAEQYRRVARDCRLMAESLPAGQNRSALLEMAEEWGRLADQQDHATDLKKE